MTDNHITFDTKLGEPMTFFINQINSDLYNSQHYRIFEIITFYNGQLWHIKHDISLFPNDKDLFSILSFTCLELVEYILKENDILCII